ncbi:hypothetical protein [Virgibacillus sp. SK37]|uniref:hypothetical protein n=1 Tax=Virgibacillus sp. SK37 TaxID=403957 RepID=UPI0004D1CBB1|nr:hypothetical protein [Virgibacillus sp. SK37]AIF45669.1 hypothetical protein X953_18955 [Virgibacillus sp. SK37]
MRAKDFGVKGMDQQFVEFYSKDHNFILTRFERIRLKEGEEPSYLYFIYIFTKKRVMKDTEDHYQVRYNLICFNKVYHSYEDFANNIDMIMGEYLVDKKELQKCLNLSRKLDPNYYG